MKDSQPWPKTEDVKKGELGVSVKDLSNQFKIVTKIFAPALLIALGACSEETVMVDTVIENVTVYSGRGDEPFIATVGVRDGVIAGISTPADASFQAERTIDGTNKFLTPGLWDAHVHLRSAEEGGLGLPAKTFIEAGITSVQDLGGYPERLKKLEEQIASGAVTGPTVHPAYFMLNGKSFAGFQHVVTNEAHVLSAIEELADLGAAQVKIHRALSPDLLPVVTKHAHSAGLTVTGHIPLGMHPLAACEAGMDGVQHIGSFIEALVSVAPEGEDNSAAAIEYMLSHAGQPLYDCLRDRGVRVTPTLISYQNRARKLAGEGEISQEFIDFINSLGAIVRRMYKEGVILLVGTDTSDFNPDLRIPPGTWLLDELEMLEEAGIPAHALIPMATLNAAEAIGVGDKTGTIGQGKAADMLLLSKDPAQSASAFRSIEMVFKAGEIIREKGSEVYVEAEEAE
ncbi:MAG: amidohydrolase family protein [Proteobacteria bacterium]|nr:amidohydrolase family protein [Pseudomonadota bacterium]